MHFIIGLTVMDRFDPSTHDIASGNNPRSAIKDIYIVGPKVYINYHSKELVLKPL